MLCERVVALLGLLNLKIFEKILISAILEKQQKLRNSQFILIEPVFLVLRVGLLLV